MPANSLSRPLFTGGAIAILLGLVALIWPGMTLSIVAIIWGIFALADGINSFTRLSGASKAEKTLYISSGVLGVLAGLLVILQPLWGMASLTWILGFWLILRGIIEIIAAFRLPKDAPKAWLVLSGVLWMLAGLLVTANPGAAMVSIVFWLGLLSIAWGVTFIVAGFRVRSAAQQIKDAL